MITPAKWQQHRWFQCFGNIQHYMRLIIFFQSRIDFVVCCQDLLGHFRFFLCVSVVLTPLLVVVLRVFVLVLVLLKCLSSDSGATLLLIWHLLPPPPSRGHDFLVWQYP